MAEFGLKRGKNGLEIYVMCEIPNNVIQIDAFAKHFDGFSIGSNDLAQLVLGVDRDSAIVAFDYDERDAGVKEMIRLSVEGCKRNKRHSGLCGQAPSDYPEMAEYLVEIGIDSISLNPDAVLKTTLHILDIEKRLGRKPRDKNNQKSQPRNDRRSAQSHRRDEECRNMINSEITVAEYLLTRLKEIGVDHLFGVPGDFVLGFSTRY